MSHDTPEPEKNEPELQHEDLLKAVQEHQRATRAASQALLRKAAQDPAGFVADLQKQVKP